MREWHMVYNYILRPIVSSLYSRTRDMLIPSCFALTLITIYIGELIIAGSFESGATFAVHSSLWEREKLLIQPISPLLHSNHNHIFYNTVFFLILSMLILPHRSLSEFIVFFALSTWFTASIGPFLLGRGVGFGISGGNAALMGWETIYRARIMVSRASSAEGWGDAISYGWNGLVVTIIGSIAILYILQAVGIYDVPPGVSVFGHFFGAVLGIYWGLVQVAKDRIYHPLKQLAD